MAQDKQTISTGPDARPVDESIAGTAPGIPDEARTPGKEPPEPPSAEEEERIRAKLGAPKKEADTLPLDGE